MADNKEYISASGEGGSVNISEEVLAIIAWEAMHDVEGFGGAAASLPSEFAELIGRKNASRGVKVTVSGKKASIDVFISVRYGYSVTKVARAIQAAICKAVEDMTGIPVSTVDVHVSGVSFDKTK